MTAEILSFNAWFVQVIIAMFDPPGLTEYKEYFTTMISIAGVLFGLAFAALLYILQSGFTSFQHSRPMFLEYYVRFGTNLLVTLSYITLVSIAAAFFDNDSGLLTLVHYVFICCFVKTRLDYLSQRGYIRTLSSRRFVPGHYGPVRKYFRLITNLGCGEFALICLTFAALIWYPLQIAKNESHSWFIITVKSIYYSTAVLLVYSLVVTVRFVPEFFRIMIMEQEHVGQSTEAGNSSIDYTQEKRVLKRFLISRSFPELENGVEISFLNGTLSVNILEHQNNPEAWFNVNVHVATGDVRAIRDSVCCYAYRLLKCLRESQVDLSTFALSFHIYADGNNRNMFFRATRSDLSAIGSEPVAAMLSLKNRIFDDLFRNIPND